MNILSWFLLFVFVAISFAQELQEVTTLTKNNTNSNKKDNYMRILGDARSSSSSHIPPPAPEEEDRSLWQALEGIYNLPPPEIFYCDDSADFVLRFEISDYIRDDMLSYEMYRMNENRECVIDISDNQYMVPGMVFDDTPQGDGSGIRRVAYFLDSESEMITSSPIYYTAPEDSDELPYINFCVRLLVSSPTGILVNWLDIEFFFYLQLSNLAFDHPSRNRQLLAMYGGDETNQDQQQLPSPETNRSDEVDNALVVSTLPQPTEDDQQQHHRHLLYCFDGFEVVLWVADRTEAPSISPAPTGPTVSPAPSDGGFVVEPPEPIDFGSSAITRNATDSYGVEAYLCDSNLEPLPLTDSNTATTEDGENLASLTQGSALRVCVVRNAKAVRDGIYLRRIDAFSYFLVGDTSVRQVAIAPIAQVANNGLTELQCVRGSHLCWFETILQADFFAGRSKIVGMGRATLQFSNRASRDLQGRDLDEDEDENSSPPVGAVSLEFVALTQDYLTHLQGAGDLNDKGKGDMKSIILIFTLIFVIALITVLASSVYYLVWFHKYSSHTKEEENQQEGKYTTELDGGDGDEECGTPHQDHENMRPGGLSRLGSTRSKDRSFSKRNSRHPSMTSVDWCGDTDTQRTSSTRSLSLRSLQTRQGEEPSSPTKSSRSRSLPVPGSSTRSLRILAKSEEGSAHSKNRSTRSRRGESHQENNNELRIG